MQGSPLSTLTVMSCLNADMPPAAGSAQQPCRKWIIAGSATYEHSLCAILLVPGGTWYIGYSWHLVPNASKLMFCPHYNCGLHYCACFYANCKMANGKLQIVLHL